MCKRRKVTSRQTDSRTGTNAKAEIDEIKRQHSNELKKLSEEHEEALVALSEIHQERLQEAEMEKLKALGIAEVKHKDMQKRLRGLKGHDSIAMKGGRL